jgi:hypothetical protein
VHDNRPIVDQLPSGDPLSLDKERTDALCAQFLNKGICQSLALTFTGGSGNDEIIRQRRDAVDVQEQDILGLFIVQKVDDDVGQFGCVQKRYLTMKNWNGQAVILAQGVGKATNPCSAAPVAMPRSLRPLHKE